MRKIVHYHHLLTYIHLKNQNDRMKKRRPHLLKIDVEGFDYDVIKGFMKNNSLVSDLPLMLMFEVSIYLASFNS